MTGNDLALLVLALLLALCAALLVCADAALSRVSRVAVDDLERSGRRGSARLKQVVADPARYLNVALFLRMACEILAVALVTAVCLGYFSEEWQALGAAALTMLVVFYVFVGVAPRTLGRQHAPRVSIVAATPLHAVATFLAPLTKLLILVGNALTPGRGFREGPFTSEAELRDLVDLAEERSLIEDDERQMIHSVFELGETIAREVMVPRTEMVFIERTKKLRQALSLGLRSGFSRIPVIGENADDVVGMVYLKDVTRRVYDHPAAESNERVESLMREAHFVPDSKPADELLRDMQAQRTHIAVVVDEYGGVAGLVTIEDVLEEIVGEITDEYDLDEQAPVEELPVGFRVASRLHVDDLVELIDVEFDEEELDDVDTVGGLLAMRLGKVPIPGASIELLGWRLTAESTAGRRNRVDSVLVEPLSPRPARESAPDAAPPLEEPADA